MIRNFLSRPATMAAAAALAVCATLSTPAHAVNGPPSNRGAGVNVNSFDYWSPDVPMINQLKRAGGWFTTCSYPKDPGCKDFTNGAGSWDTLEESKLDLDGDGYPNRLPDPNDNTVKYRSVAALMFQEDSRVHYAGKYVVLYEGNGTINYDLAGTKVAAESAPGRDVVMVTNTDTAGLRLTIAATDPANHIRNIRVLPPGGVCSGNTAQFALTDADCSSKGLGALVPFEKLGGRLFHPAYTADLKGFRTLRFLDWNRANQSPLANWADRPRLGDAIWTGPGGVPVNAMVMLANEVGADPWINLPTYASDDYARRFAQQLKGVLAPKLNLIVEYSNEPWNFGFAQAGWMRDQAAKLWPDQIAKGVSPYDLQPSWYGMRSAQLCKIIKTEFGADASRVKCVFNGQASNAWYGQQSMDCPYAQAIIGQACYKVMDGLAIAPYFAGYIGGQDARKYVATWYSDADGGLGKLFQEILGEDANGNKVTPPLYGKVSGSYVNGAVAQVKTWMTANKANTDARGLPLMSYEGGQHLVMYPGDNDQSWLNLITAANRDPRMAKAYTRTLQDWQSTGSQVYTLYNHVYHPGKWGAWGLKETQFDNSNVKWQAVLPYRDNVTCWWAGCQR